jgi:hypothetical protein
MIVPSDDPERGISLHPRFTRAVKYYMCVFGLAPCGPVSTGLATHSASIAALFAPASPSQPGFGLTASKPMACVRVKGKGRGIISLQEIER